MPNDPTKKAANVTLPEAVSQLTKRVEAYHANLLELRKKESSDPEANVSKSAQQPIPPKKSGTYRRPRNRKPQGTLRTPTNGGRISAGFQKDEIVPSVAAGQGPTEAPAGSQETYADDYVGGDITAGQTAANNLMSLISKGAAIKGGKTAEAIAKTALTGMPRGHKTGGQMKLGKAAVPPGKKPVPSIASQAMNDGRADLAWEGGYEGAPLDDNFVPPAPKGPAVARPPTVRKPGTHVPGVGRTIPVSHPVPGGLHLPIPAEDYQVPPQGRQARIQGLPGTDAHETLMRHLAPKQFVLKGELEGVAEMDKAETQLMSLLKQEIYINHSGKAKGKKIAGSDRLVEVGAVEGAYTPFDEESSEGSSSSEESSAQSEEVSAPGSGGEIKPGKSKPKDPVKKGDSVGAGSKGKATADKPKAAPKGKQADENPKAVGGQEGEGKHPGFKKGELCSKCSKEEVEKAQCSCGQKGCKYCDPKDISAKKAEILSKPPVSEAQRKAMGAAASGNSTLDIPKKVGKEFINADKGGKLPVKKGELEKQAMLAPPGKLNALTPKATMKPGGMGPIGAAQSKMKPSVTPTPVKPATTGTAGGQLPKAPGAGDMKAPSATVKHEMSKGAKAWGESRKAKKLEKEQIVEFSPDGKSKVSSHPLHTWKQPAASVSGDKPLLPGTGVTPKPAKPLGLKVPARKSEKKS